jgi:septum formation protein
MTRLILASSSPRRFELLTATSLSFEVARPDIDESPHRGEAPAEYVIRLSREKALAVATAIQGADGNDAIIVSADTTVADEGGILGKPADAEDAAAMLRRLRGHAHMVYTGLSVLNSASDGPRPTSALTSSQVTLRDFTEAQIAEYVASGDPLGKAGSYAIQNTEFRPVERLEGCYTNVVGLPLCTLCSLLRQHGIELPTAVPCSPTELPCAFGAL